MDWLSANWPALIGGLTLILLAVLASLAARARTYRRETERLKDDVHELLAAPDPDLRIIVNGIRIPSNYGPRYREEFENAFRDVATTCKIRWIEFFMEGIAENPELMQADGIHPNAAAQPRLLDNAWPIIRAALDDLG